MSKKIKQISYLSAIMISVGSTIGAGIFFKNGSIFDNVNGSMGLMITAWLVAGIGVLALGLALVELSSASEKDGGILEWARKFMPKKLSKVSASYMLLVYLPLNYLAMPLYIVNTLQDAIQSIDPDVEINGWYVGLMAFGFFMFAAFMDWMRHSASEKLQVIIAWVKFIPLIMVAAFAIYATTQSGVQTTVHDSENVATSITAYAPALGIIASIPAILFAYDGFYAITSLKTDMKDSSKLGPVVAIAISTITGAYVLFGILTGMAGERNFTGFMGEADFKYALMITNLLIMIAIYAILNAFAMITYRMYDDVYENQPVGIVGFMARIFKIKEHKKAAFYASIALTVVFYVALIPTGIYGFDSGDYGDIYGFGAGNLYSMTDMLTNYTSLVAFLIIVGGVLGALHNRKTNKIKVDKKWYFVPAAWIASIFALTGAVYMVINNIAGMAGLNGAITKTEITKFVILTITLAISIIPAFIPDRNIQKFDLAETTRK